MPSLRSILPLLLEPVLAVGLFCMWASLVGGTFVNYVPIRTSSFDTNPYALLITVGFAVAIGLMRKRPSWSIILAGALLLIQVLYWPTRFGQTSWVAYGALPVIAFGFGMFARPVPRATAAAVAAVGAISTSALLNVPALSLSGKWGMINGKIDGSPEILPGLLSWAAVGLIVGFAAWRVGAAARGRLRRNTLVPGPAGGEEELAYPELSDLSPREKEIYQLIASGMSNREIAAVANIEESTVKTHVSNVLAKLHLRSRAQLIALARRTTPSDPTALLGSA